MTYSHHALSVLALAVCSAACSDDETTPSSSSGSGTEEGSSSSSGGSSSSSGTAAQPSNNTVDLEVTGDFAATLRGQAGTCGGVEGGASFSVLSADLGVSPAFELAVVILSEPDWPTPPTVLNVKEGERASYVWNKTNGTIVAQRDRSRVDIDADLKSITGSIVHVKGSIVCNP